MLFDHADRFAVLLSGGVGMALAGGGNVLLGRQCRVVRAVVTGAGCGLALGLVALYRADAVLVMLAAAVMTAGVLPVVLAGSERLVELLLRPAVRWGLLVAAGVLTAAGSVAMYQVEDNAHTDRDMELLGLELERPPLVDTGNTIAQTDRGTLISARQPAVARDGNRVSQAERHFLQTSPFSDQLMRRREAGDTSNCHGWVFTDGRYWLGEGTVELILDENGYVDVTAPRPGDLVIYRLDGKVSHTGVVRYVSDGVPVLVEGKWGAMGVYVHPAEHSPYGTPTFYRSARVGHLLAGLAEVAPIQP